MMKYIFTGMIVLSVISAVFTGRIEAVSTAAMTGASEAVQLILRIGGMMCLWSGFMQVADKAGITKALSRLLSPLTRILFKGLRQDGPAMRAISMNMAANLLGLGNAATPLGIKAMQEMEKVAPQPGTASDDMITFVVLNTASLQLIPTTTALIRQTYGSTAPMEILSAVWLASFVSVCAAVGASKLYGIRRGKHRRVMANHTAGVRGGTI